jgi:hypothetical protein
MDAGKIEWINIPSRSPAPESNNIYKHQQENTEEVRDSVNLDSSTGKAPKLPKWTIMHYTAADNDLNEFLNMDVNEMESIGSTKNMNIISLLDNGKDDVKIYHIQKDNDPENITSPVLKDLGETNTAQPETLAKFIEFSMKKFPAQHYALIIGSHGLAWKGAVEDETTDSFMSLPQIREALDTAAEKTGKKLDLIGFDACLMATGEVAYELKDNAKYMVASQEVE